MPGGFPLDTWTCATSTNGRPESTPARSAGLETDAVTVVHLDNPRFDRSLEGRGVRNGSASGSSSGRSVRSSRPATITPARQYAPSPSTLESLVVVIPRVD